MYSILSVGCQRVGSPHLCNVMRCVSEYIHFSRFVNSQRLMTHTSYVICYEWYLYLSVYT